MRNVETRSIEEPVARPVQKQMSSPRILVVDDDRATRQLNVDFLTDQGYDVEAVMDGVAGWNALQAKSYDVIITDNQMPKMTGVQMIEKIRDAYMTTPVIMATGLLPQNEFDRKPWLKPDVTLQRPFSNEDLLAAVKDVLNADDGRDDVKESLIPKYL
jgi:DNA-binding response OmpR family regulator